MGGWRTFVAIGDSFTEGLDDWRADGTPRGWADRVAERLAADKPDFRYANLAVRGKVLDQIVADQIPVAERLRPDLVAFCAGGNDIIRISCDTDDLARRFDAALARITATGAHVLVFTGFDLGRMHPLIRRLRGRIACYNELMRASAERRGGTGRRPVGHDPARRPRTWGSRPRCTSPPRATAAWRCGCWSAWANPSPTTGARRSPRPPPPRGATGSSKTCGGCGSGCCRSSRAGCRAARPATASSRNAPSCSPSTNAPYTGHERKVDP